MKKLECTIIVYEKNSICTEYNKKPMSSSNLVEKFLMVVNYYY